MAEGNQPAANGDLTAARVQRRRERTVRVKFLRDTVHPDYGEVKEGEVYTVGDDYADDYEDLGIAQVTDEPATERSTE